MKADETGKDLARFCETGYEEFWAGPVVCTG